HDAHSVGRTAVNPDWAKPRFLARGRDDYRLFGMLAGQRFTSPGVDLADPATDLGVPAAAAGPNLLTNPSFASGVTGGTVSPGAGTGSANPAPFEGGAYFAGYAAAVGFATQTIDLIAAGFSAAEIDAQDLVAVFGGRVRSFDQLPPDRGQVTLQF